MPICYAAIMPHGDELLPIHPPEPALQGLRDALHGIGREMRECAPDLIVLCSPHHLRVRGHLAIAHSAYLEGSLRGPLGEVALRARVDQGAAALLAQAARDAGLPPALVGYGTSEESDLSCLPLDWGSLVPLHFVAPRGELPPVALLGPPRDLGLVPLRRFGEALRERLSDRRFALIASADLAHAHDPEGPYGFDPAAALYDDAVQQSVLQGDLARLSSLDPELLSRAKADAPWQLAILEGVLGGPRAPRHLAYARPTYFGMLSCGFAADGEAKA